MSQKNFWKNERGDVLGIPMYLIIIMVVAVAVIAAVVFMIPKATRTMNAQVTSNALIAEAPGSDGGGVFTFSKTYTIWVKVTTNDQRADPIAGATVTLVGAGDASQAKTLTNGSAKITGIKPILDANINEAHLILTVKATGFEDFIDTKAVTVVRLG
ncbi:MAG: hypothetical protein BV459_03465 [Thermoplasmata archaeon M11B2D]|nr:MAG: hypothetical protein BV459_03465 [Thermoplasmata archaeon M11B2D]PNX53368.1 MAG: hypothetical protein BV458_04825 [Thermoplasmata archaeon M9B2D]